MPIKLLLLRTDIDIVNIASVDPPLGLLSLSAAIKRELPGKVDVRIKDMRLRGQNPKSLTKYLLEWQPEVVGISALSAEEKRTGFWADHIRKTLPGTKIVIGGPYATAEKESCLQRTKADAVFLGEAESSLCAWLRCLLQGKPPDAVPGLILWNERGEPFATSAQEIIKDIDSLPVPDWDAIDITEYHFGKSMNLISAHKRYAPIKTSRGCPYACIFCHQFFGKTVRFRDLSLVMEEISILYYKHGIREIQIVDDIFNINRKRVLDFCRRLKESGMKIYISFPNGLRSDLLTEEVIDALVEAGTYSMTFAIETASARLQKMIKKNLDLEKAARMVRYAYGKGIITNSFFMLGFLSETREEIQQTIDMAMSLPLLQVNFFTVVPQKNTEFYRMVLDSDPAFAKGDAPVYWGHNPAYMSKQGIDLPAIRKKAIIRFYFSSFRIVILFWRSPGKLIFLKILMIGILQRLDRVRTTVFQRDRAISP